MKQKKSKRAGPATQPRRKLLAISVTGVVIVGLIFVAWRALAPPSGETTLDVTVPALSGVAAAGKTAFDANCAECHGRNAGGTEKGPPLVHDIYNPGHHGDAAFFFAARQGVPQHHWPFGNMPPRPEASDEDIAAIIRYVRELQSANGIDYRPHRM